MTRLEIRTTIRDLTQGDTYFTNDQINNFINTAVRNIFAKTRHTEEARQINSVAGQFEYAIENDVQSILTVTYDDGYPLTHRGYEVIANTHVPSDTAPVGTPTEYYERRTARASGLVVVPGATPTVSPSLLVLGLMPIPNEVKVIKYHCSIGPSAMTMDTDTPQLPEEMHMGIVEYCLKYLMMMGSEPVLSREYGNMFRESQMNAKSAAKPNPRYIREVED